VIPRGSGGNLLAWPCRVGLRVLLSDTVVPEDITFIGIEKISDKVEIDHSKAILEGSRWGLASII
jgi:hypothetical protein